VRESLARFGSAKTYKDVLENPDRIFKKPCWRKGSTAGLHRILSIDIADVDVGDNIARNFRPSKPKPTSVSRKPKRKWSRRGGRSGTGDARQDAGDAGQSCLELKRSCRRHADAFRAGNLGIMDYVG